MLLSTAKLPIVTLLLLAGLSAGCSHNINTAPLPSPKLSPVNDTLVQQLQQQAVSWQDVPYRYGGHDKSGIDCSGFIQTTFNTVMQVQLPRSTKEQVKVGTKIARENIQAGDLIFFKTGQKQRHIGIYIEQGKFVHASTSKGVIVSNLSNPYWYNNYWQSRRVLAEIKDSNILPAPQ